MLPLGRPIASSSSFLITISLQPDVEDLGYLKNCEFCQTNYPKFELFKAYTIRLRYMVQNIRFVGECLVPVTKKLIVYPDIK